MSSQIEPAHKPQAPHLHSNDRDTYLHPNPHSYPHPHPQNPSSAGAARIHPTTATQYNISPPPPNNPFLTCLLLRTLRVTTTDGRWFVGELKCTDRDRNLILERTHEYRSISKPSGAGSIGGSIITTTTVTTTTTSSSTTSSLADSASITITGGRRTGTEPETNSQQVGGGGVAAIGTGEENSRLVDTPEGTIGISAGGSSAPVNTSTTTHSQSSTSRFLGLVVIPGEVIVKIELVERNGVGSGIGMYGMGGFLGGIL